MLAASLLAQVGVGIDRFPTPLRSAEPPSVSCRGAADPAIDSATDEKTDTTAGIDSFDVHVSVLNRGSASQGRGALQVVSVYREETRIARMHVPALEVGEAYAFTFKFKRSAEAGPGSTTLLFRLGGTNYAPHSIEDCNDQNDALRLTF